MPSQQQLGARDEEAKTRHVGEERKAHLFLRDWGDFWFDSTLTKTWRFKEKEEQQLQVKWFPHQKKQNC